VADGFQAPTDDEDVPRFDGTASVSESFAQTWPEGVG